MNRQFAAEVWFDFSFTETRFEFEERRQKYGPRRVVSGALCPLNFSLEAPGAVYAGIHHSGPRSEGPGGWLARAWEGFEPVA
jgi:hypothetical protein